MGVVEVQLIDTDGEMIDFFVCCAHHAREMCQTEDSVVWWEIADSMGNIIDSADKVTEEIECCGEIGRHE